MQITRQTNYALRVLMYCSADGAPVSKVPAIAQSYGISETYLFKILPVLTKAGLIETVRGRAGGIRLAREADSIGVGEVVRATEERFAMAECFEHPDAPCPLIGACGLQSLWSEALGAFLSALDRYTIADIVASHGIRGRLGLSPA
ncbi:MAG: Rrf2 family transcriptional regulator [Devosia sp.]